MARSKPSSSAAGTRARGVQCTTGWRRFPPPLEETRKPKAAAMAANARIAAVERVGRNPTYAAPDRIIMRNASATAAGRGNASRSRSRTSSRDSPRFRAFFSAFLAARREETEPPRSRYSPYAPPVRASSSSSDAVSRPIESGGDGTSSLASGLTSLRVMSRMPRR